MDINVARHVVRACFRSSQELENLLSLLKGHCSADEYTKYAKAIASAIASIHLEVMNRVIAAYPQLESEIEVSIAKHGRYL